MFISIIKNKKKLKLSEGYYIALHQRMQSQKNIFLWAINILYSWKGIKLYEDDRHVIFFYFAW